MAENREPLQELHSQMATTTAELKEWRALATEAAVKVKVAHSDVSQQSAVQEPVREERVLKEQR